MRKALRIILVILVIVGISTFFELVSPDSVVRINNIPSIEIDALNKMTAEKQINYTGTKYSRKVDALIVIDLEGNEYILSNASKRKLQDNLTDEYLKQMFAEYKSSAYLTTESSMSFTNIAMMSMTMTFYVGLFYILFKSMGSAISKSKEIGRAKHTSTIKFDDVKGHREAKVDLSFIIDFMKDPKKYKKINARFTKGIILYGPPGTGKTLLAKALAGEADVPIYTANGSDFVEMYVGLGAKRVRELFNEAKKNAPSIVFIDEIDSVAQKRSGGSDGGTREHDQTLNALLACLDGFNGNDDVLVVASTNRLDILDPAILRPGRFDKHIEIGYPDLDDRADIAELYLTGKKVNTEITPKFIAKQTYGFTGAMIDNLINESALIAAINNHDEIGKDDISHAMLKVITGGDKKLNYKKDSDKLELISLHEAGHALVYRELCNISVPKVSIIPTTNGALGWTMTSHEDAGLLSKKDLEHQVMGLYAGRVCEEIYFKGDKSKVTTGASNDIKQATKLLYSMITEYGFDDNVGNINMAVIQEHSKFSSNDQVMKLLTAKSDELYTKTLQYITEKYDIIEKISDELLEKETIDQTELDSIIFNNAEIDLEKTKEY